MDVDKREVRRSLRTDFNPSLKLRGIRAVAATRRALNYPAYLLGGRIDRPIFIIGAPRSGTSLLYAILRASGRTAHWPGEAHEVWEHDYHPALRGWESNALDASDIAEPAARRIRRSFFLVAGGNKHLIDKTPRNALRVAFVDALFDDSRFIFLQRDGRDNVNSLITAWRTPRYRTYRLPEPHAIPGVDPKWWKFVLYSGWRADTSGPLELVCANQWVSSNQCALDDLVAVPDRRRVTIRYEDLVDRPVEEVGRIMEFLDLPYEDAVRAKAQATSTNPINIVTPPERGKWRRENPSEIGSIVERIAPTMARLGYEV
jgi:Sulfotransferase family